MSFRNIDTDRQLESVVQYGDSNYELRIFDDNFSYYIDNCINWQRNLE